MTKVITFKNRSVPVHYPSEQLSYMELLQNKLQEMEYNFDFRKKWKRIKSVEMIRDVAILQYSDGTKLYLEVC
ncbi:MULTISPECIES: hypothetical protein [Paenibacillus]|uniref:Uncharacterized protein n=2 Tax=Paenibacillus TaxID=44249 RepID=A0A7X4YU94_9BACL|nr:MULTISPECIES: hypothetical protein [Paenibacillus]MBM7568972.1 putative house-cleaning noncanonical NTP pyrophosphatase (MazG superfamily) [Paenibacillus sacheonensis]NBC72655.1 hypothetical protein [Paenibacillus sacheonensis]NBD27496.1 hypothetical protein [Paenibacillus glycinis]